MEKWWDDRLLLANIFFISHSSYITDLTEWQVGNARQFFHDLLLFRDSGRDEYLGGSCMLEIIFYIIESNILDLDSKLFESIISIFEMYTKGFRNRRSNFISFRLSEDER